MYHFLTDKRWVDKFLWKAEEEQPASSLDSDIPADDLEVKTQLTTSALIDTVEDTFLTGKSYVAQTQKMRKIILEMSQKKENK